MQLPFRLRHLWPYLLSAQQPLSQLPHGCKSIPTSPDWPDAAAWQALNRLISGRLIAPTPPAAVCHTPWPQYNKSDCLAIATQWTNSSFHALNPVSSDYNDETCLPDPNSLCSAAGYPVYVVVAINAQDVQAAVKFARDKGVRLVVKGTGHDFPGRSSGAYSLSVYTHNLRGLDLVKYDSRAVALGGIASLKIQAGERMGDIYAFAVANNVTVIGGADPGVGIGGWISGGGHGPLTAKYGMGADQVLEMEVVTADGNSRVVNERQDADLFWALRGGGASTFALLVSVTVKVYAPVPATRYTFSYATKKDSDTFWSMTARFHAELPRLVDAGLMGYYFVNANDQHETKDHAGKVQGILIGPQLSASEVQAIMLPMQVQLSNASQWNDPVYLDVACQEHRDFTEMWNRIGKPYQVGASARIGSRLLDRGALFGNMTKLEDALRKSSPQPWEVLGHLVGGPGTKRPPNGIAGGENAVVPAWRETVTHVILPRVWPAHNESLKALFTNELRDVSVEALRELAPNTGTYMNEADPTEPDWQRSLFGENYDKLLKVKRKWDPAGVFWCHHCVGSELWMFEGDDGLENGIGQSLGRLCWIGG